LQAAEILKDEGIYAEVINIHTIKPLDKEAILNSVKKTGCLVTAEEHNKYGGMGESIAGFLSSVFPVPQEFVAVNDSFGESGKPDELMKKYHLDVPDIVEAAKKSIARKKGNN
jgi:transketolase